jgi:ribosomal protein L22
MSEEEKSETSSETPAVDSTSELELTNSSVEATNQVEEAPAPQEAAVAEAPAKPKRTRAAKPKADEAPKAEVAKAEKAEGAKAEKAKPAAPAKPSKPAPTRRREAREPGAPVPVVRAQAKYVRSSARKARLVCDNIRGKSVEDARAILAHTPRAVARDWSKLLESAVANAEHNHELVGEDLVIKAVHADEGPTIKRFRPRAMGRASKIRKRTAHLTILLTPKN